MSNLVSWSKVVGVAGLVLGGLATLVSGYSDMLERSEIKKNLEKEIRKEVARQLSKTIKKG